MIIMPDDNAKPMAGESAKEAGEITYGCVLKKLNIDHYFDDINTDAEKAKSKKRKVKFMTGTIKSGIIAAIVSLVVSVTVFVIFPGKNYDAEIKALNSQLQTISSIMKANYEDGEKRKAADMKALPLRPSALDRPKSTFNYLDKPFGYDPDAPKE